MAVQDYIESSTASAVGKAATYGGGSAAVIFGLDANVFGIVVGVVVGLAGLLISYYYQRKTDKRNEILHEIERERQQYELNLAKKRLEDWDGETERRRSGGRYD